MKDKYLSIITNFGCHYKCPYCIVKENGLAIPITTMDGLNGLENAINETGSNIISVSGGGDPLHNFDKEENKLWYKKLFEIAGRNNLPVEMHTSYIDSSFDYSKCIRVVYHLRQPKDILNIQQYGEEIRRVVFVVTEDFELIDLAFIKSICNKVGISELSFRQMVNNKYEEMYYLNEELEKGHELGYWHYIKQNDYNIYYCENEVKKRYEDFR